MDEGQETGSELVIAHGNATEHLELEEEGFNKVTLLVKPPVDVPRISVVRLRRDTEIRVMIGAR